MMAYRCQGSGARANVNVAVGLHYYGGDGHWYRPHTNTQHFPPESRYSDFVPYDYDDRSLLTRILDALNYARSSILQTSTRSIRTHPSSIAASSRGSRSSTLCDSDTIEMISSSPSPTLHGSNPSRSPSSFNGSYKSSRFSSSPRLPIKHPPAVAFPRGSPSTSTSQKRPHSQSWYSPGTTTKDAGTQCTPLPHPSTPNTPSDKRKVAQSPELKEPPPEPDLRPQTASKPANLTTDIPTTVKAPAAPTTTQSSSSSNSTSTPSQESSPKRVRPSTPPIKYMPLAYETCDTKDLVLLISNMLLELIKHNDSIPLQDGRLTRFHSRAPPSITVKDYLQRLTTHATLSPPILLSMVYYIDRLCALYPAFTISSLTVHRFLITAATVASKGLSDSFWTNSTYAKVGGVQLKELALLELEFLWRVEWRIVPRPEVLGDYYRSLVERSEGFRIEREGGRGSRSSSKGSQSSEGGTGGGEKGGATGGGVKEGETGGGVKEGGTGGGSKEGGNGENVVMEGMEDGDK